MIVLGIETSCDETSVGIVDDNKILINSIYTQEVHKNFGGVIPEIASRAHLQKLLPILRDALDKISLKLNEIELISATAGPGLIGALIVGYCFARGLSYSLNKKFIPVNHIDGHIYSAFLDNGKPEFPFLTLLISGGHTSLYLVKNFYEVESLGKTLDDAVGEAFDKVGKMLGMQYPAGAQIERAALAGDEDFVEFPIAYLKDTLNFSFSGIKTAVMRFIHKEFPSGIQSEDIRNNISASFQKAVANILIYKLELAIKRYSLRNVCVVGGVASNTYLKRKIENALSSLDVKFSVPSRELCTDNGAMIAYAGLKSFETNYYLKNSISQPFPN